LSVLSISKYGPLIEWDNKYGYRRMHWSYFIIWVQIKIYPFLEYNL
jgi:hypothetical protein